MSPSEMSDLLAKIQLGDNRQVDKLTLAHWLETIGHLDYRDAYMAVVEHQRNSTEYLQPGHITRLVRAHKPDTAITMSPEVPDDCGRHRWLGDGTCNFCTARRDP